MILFLDFDGVLHPISSRIIRREAGSLVIDQGPEGEPLFCRVPLLAAVLRDFPQVRIVLSTSWTRYVPKAALLEPLEGLADRVIGSLSPYERGTRYERVQTFLEPFDGEPWIAIEDDRRNFPETAPVLWTDSSTGLTVQDLGKLRKWLAGGTPRIQVSDEVYRARLAAINFARGSVQLEGFILTPEAEAIHQQYARGEITANERIDAIKRLYG